MPAPTPKLQLATFLSKYDPSVARTVTLALTKLRRLLPGALELVYDNYNALAIGFSPTERASDVLCSIAAYPRWVSLFFMRGVTLPDPAGVLRGSGKQVRHVVLDDASTIDRPEIRALFAQAIAIHPTPFDARARPRIIIKSVSARQRPRRPARPRS